MKDNIKELKALKNKLNLKQFFNGIKVAFSLLSIPVLSLVGLAGIAACFLAPAGLAFGGFMHLVSALSGANYLKWFMASVAGAAMLGLTFKATLPYEISSFLANFYMIGFGNYGEAMENIAKNKEVLSMIKTCLEKGNVSDEKFAEIMEKASKDYVKTEDLSQEDKANLKVKEVKTVEVKPVKESETNTNDLVK